MSRAFVNEDQVAASVDNAIQDANARRATRPITQRGYHELQRKLETATRSGDTALVQNLTTVLSQVAVPLAVPFNSAAQFATRITVKLPDGQTVDYELVGPDEVDIQLRRVSISGPIGLALSAAHKGDLVDVSLPRGNETWEIIEVAPLYF